MLKKSGSNTHGHEFWTLLVPKEHCKEGLEVGLVTNKMGLYIGGELISWQELEDAKHKAFEERY